MDEPSPNPRHLALWLGLAFGLILAVGSGLAWMLARGGARRPVRILLVTPPQGAASGLDAAECRAIGALAQDHLECLGGLAVTSVTAIPEDLGPLKMRPHSRVLVLEPRRQGDALVLAFRTAEGDQVGSGNALSWVRTEAPALPPSAAFEAFDRRMGLTPKGPAGDLTPRDPARFWDLIHATALRLQNDHLDQAIALAGAIVHAEPGCATGWVLLGNLQYRRLLNNPAAFRKEQADAEALLRKGLELAPGHPRATFLLSLMESDSGNQREALDLLIQARRTQPNNPTLLTGLAYAARGAGLLPLARRAMDLRDSLAFSEYLPQAVDITCLYTGEIPRFEASLQDRPGHLRNTTGVIPFYRGYLALVQGDRVKAHDEFTTARQAPHGYPNIVRLSEVFDLILDGRKEEAWTKLREFDQDRIGMREPDGEFTIRLAEAYAVLGDRASAMEMASRAFARGFGCTAWYERSPLLQSLRSLPKWKALLQHLKERQSLMEEAFPASLVESPS
jgi:tetratricopeptide (TPR) repeat protein